MSHQEWDAGAPFVNAEDGALDTNLSRKRLSQKDRLAIGNM